MKLIRLKDVLAMTGISCSQVYRMMQSGDFPKQVKVSKNCVAWNDDEVIAFVQARIDARNAVANKHLIDCLDHQIAEREAIALERSRASSEVRIIKARQAASQAMWKANSWGLFSPDAVASKRS